MATALDMATRRNIIQAHLEGQSYRALAQDFEVAYNTIRTLCKRYQEHGQTGLVPHYNQCGPKGIRSDRLLYRAACWLKRRHPKWGAAFIRLKLEKRYPEKPMPAVRTMQVWFRNRGLNTPRSKQPRNSPAWAKTVHQVWQVDANEHQQTANGQKLCYLNVTDEKSTAVLATPVFPPQTDLPSPVENSATSLD